MSTYPITIRMHHSDAAGLAFFASLFTIAHECYETYLEPEVTFPSIFGKMDLMIPIVHAEADYHKPLRVSDKITVTLRLGKISNSSFSLEYDFRTENGEHAATVKTSHVVRGKNGERPVSLPDKLRHKLQSLSDR